MQDYSHIKIFSVGALITVVCCVGLFLYTQWDMKRFMDSLPKVPISSNAQNNNNSPVLTPQTDTQHTTLTISESSSIDAETESTENDAVHTETEEKYIPEDADDALNFFEELPEEAHTAELQEEEESDLSDSEMVPFDIEKVKAGFDDYNDYIHTDPEYAYQRLDEAFREQYGDSPDVNILIETIRSDNEGNGTIDNAITNLEALLRLLPRISPSEGVQEVANELESLRELKQLALETGKEIHYNQVHYFEGN